MASYGTIITRVFTSQALVPVRGAMVAFTQNNPDGRQTLQAVRVSDANGMTPPVRLSAPDSGNGTNPDDKHPFFDYNIWTEAPGFEYSIIRNVQLFPSVETIQNIELVPLPQSRAQAQNTEFTEITPQDL